MAAPFFFVVSYRYTTFENVPVSNDIFSLENKTESIQIALSGTGPLWRLQKCSVMSDRIEEQGPGSLFPKLEPCFGQIF